MDIVMAVEELGFDDDIETLDISFIDKGTKKAKIKSDNYDNTEKSNGFIKFILFLFIIPY